MKMRREWDREKKEKTQNGLQPISESAGRTSLLGQAVAAHEPGSAGNLVHGDADGSTSQRGMTLLQELQSLKAKGEKARRELKNQEEGGGHDDSRRGLGDDEKKKKSATVRWSEQNQVKEYEVPTPEKDASFAAEEDDDELLPHASLASLR